MEAQSVVVIQDASRAASVNAIRWALHGLSLKPGDTLTLLAVLHQVNNPLGYKSKGEFSCMLKPKQRHNEIEAITRKETYHNSVELMQMSKLYHMLKIGLKVEVATGGSCRVVALRAAEKLKATWVILDRQMKKERKYFLQKLSCGISRMKHNDNIELLRGPKSIQGSHNCQMAYDEMLPEEDDLFSIELFPTSQVEADQDQVLTQCSTSTNLVGRREGQERFEYSRCTICNNRQPRLRFFRDFKYSELKAATNGFSSNNSLSNYGFGVTYRGQLKCKMNIIVQLHENAGSHGEAKFKSQVYRASTIMHKNVIILLGWCTQGNHRMLVYEYACNGSLNKHLSKYILVPLKWTERINIALGAARGLHYLHQNDIVHRDIRPSNILLTHDFEPLLGGFGIARMHHESDPPSKFEVAGTYGYMAPDYAENGKVSSKADIYSFGVVLLELITGRNAADTLGDQSLALWARPLLKENKYRELIDPRIAHSHDADQLQGMVQVARVCTTKNPDKRLPMDKVISALECVTEGKSSLVIEEEKVVQKRSSKNGVRFNEITRFINRSFSLRSSANVSTISTCSSSGKSSSSSYRMLRTRSARPQLSYHEMLN